LTNCAAQFVFSRKANTVGIGTLRPKWREWPARGIRRFLSERVAFGMLLAALFAFLPSSS
jgi:hypothetical protein